MKIEASIGRMTFTGITIKTILTDDNGKTAMITIRQKKCSSTEYRYTYYSFDGIMHTQDSDFFLHAGYDSFNPENVWHVSAMASLIETLSGMEYSNVDAFLEKKFPNQIG